MDEWLGGYSKKPLLGGKRFKINETMMGPNAVHSPHTSSLSLSLYKGSSCCSLVSIFSELQPRSTVLCHRTSRSLCSINAPFATIAFMVDRLVEPHVSNLRLDVTRFETAAGKSSRRTSGSVCALENRTIYRSAPVTVIGSKDWFREQQRL